ncbi:MAG: hypothetical protein ACD_3C00123G0009 [uncultured bacterium (gcode 4)]|uniref:Branched-chain amino acid ABC transporter permease n=1 Tax=uncultured bacterium (gcode 4) TaxID=1234023 RepID=K2FYA9_9BACT|nr:MAG: hypothetical protein ACD_3C00123G0009 [uncultured bacterium (gcode 4)]
MDYFVHIAIFIWIYTILSLGLNLVIWYAWLLNVTQAAFYGIWAYITAILTSRYQMNFFVAMLVGVLVCSVLSYLIWIVLSKFSWDFYALGSIWFNFIVFSILLNLESITNGSLGIRWISKPQLFFIDFSPNSYFLILVIAITALLYLFSKYIVNSSYWRVLKSIREDEEAIRAFWYDTLYFKLSIFIIWAWFASIAGSLFASYMTFIDPTSFTIHESIFMLTIVILGWLANLKWSVLWAVILIILPEVLRFIWMPEEIAAQSRQLMYGLVLVLLMLYRPQWLIWEYKL